MLVSTTTFVRPSTSVDFFTVSDEATANFNTKFLSTGKVFERSSTVSPDGLTLTLINKYISKAAFEEFLADPVSIAMKEARLLYSVANNISIEYHGEETLPA